MDKLAIIDAVMKEAKKRPDDLFKAVFWDIAEKARDVMKLEGQKAVLYIKNTMMKDLKEKGYSVKELDIKLGFFRGHPYITSAPVSMTGVKDNDKVLGYLVAKYSPKYKFKGEVDGVSTFNLR